jgi:putative ABC transport system permease protein
MSEIGTRQSAPGAIIACRLCGSGLARYVLFRLAHMSMQIHLRRLLRSRVFLVAAVLLLGLGLGVNLILFNSAYALLWRPLNFPQPDRLVTVKGRSVSGDLLDQVTGQDAWMLREQPALVKDVGLTGRRRLASLIVGDAPIDVASALADSGYFRTLGLRPVAGRFFGGSEDRGENSEQPAVMAERVWRTHFGADPTVVGREFLLQEGGRRRPVRIIGIVSGAATLPFAPDAEILLPLASASPNVRLNSGDALYRCVVRLQAGVTPAGGSAPADAAMRRTDPEWGHHWLESLRTAVSPMKNSTIVLLYASACLLLVLTCANLASLFAARAMARQHETSVHLALGATRGRVLGDNFQEALLVCAMGTGLAFLVEDSVRPLVPRFIPAVKNAGAELLATSPVLLVFGLLICLTVACVVSAASGWRFRMDAIAATLAQGGRTGGSRAAGRFRAALAAGQLAIVLTLLTVSGMVGRSFLAAMHAAPGLDAKGVVTFQVSLPGSERATLPALSELARQMSSVAGVRSVAFAAELPVGSPAFSTVTAARAGKLEMTDPMIDYRLIGASYFDTLRAHLTDGRSFQEDEVQQGRPVAILNESAKRLLFGGDAALGRLVHSGIGDRKSIVVGVVKDIRTEGLDQATVPMVYLPYFPGFGLRFIVRTSGTAAAAVPLLRERVRAGNAGVLLQRFRPLDEILDDTVRDRRVSGVLVAGFALLGLIISSVGLYGTLAAQVQQRRREIGVRMALGATVRSVAGAVLGEGLRILVLGALAGMAASVAAGRLIQGQLYGVSPLDLTSFAAALALLATAAVAACLIPAFKAAHVDPIQALNVQ